MQKGLVAQRLHQIENRRLAGWVRKANHHLGGVDRETAAKTAHWANALLSASVSRFHDHKSAVAIVRACVERRAARSRAREQAVDPQDVDACRAELDGQRNTVERGGQSLGLLDERRAPFLPARPAPWKPSGCAIEEHLRGGRQ